MDEEEIPYGLADLYNTRPVTGNMRIPAGSQTNRFPSLSSFITKPTVSTPSIAKPAVGTGTVLAPDATVPPPPPKKGFLDKLSDGLFGSEEDAETDKRLARGPSEGVANIMGLGNLALGLAGYFENKKTAELQREGMEHDIAVAKEHRANRAALGNSWAKAWK